MKRLLGGERMKWAHPVAKYWQAGIAVAVFACLGVLLFAQGAQAAPATSGKWLNRMYIVGSNNQNYFDSNTYDNNFSYAEQNPADTCADVISFVFTNSGGEDTRNENFF